MESVKIISVVWLLPLCPARRDAFVHRNHYLTADEILRDLLRGWDMGRMVGLDALDHSRTVLINRSL